MHTRLFLVALTLTAPLVCAASTSPMQEGLWELTTQTEVAGIGAPRAPTTARTCLSRQDVEASDAAAPKDDQCEVRDYRLQGNQATWSIECRGKERVAGTGSITFNGRTAYSGQARLTVQMPGATAMQITHHYEGRRVGDCSK